MNEANVGPQPKSTSPSRTSLVVDGALAAALAAFITVATYFDLQHQPTHRRFDAWTVVLVVIAAGALAGRGPLVPPVSPVLDRGDRNPGVPVPVGPLARRIG